MAVREYVKANDARTFCGKKPAYTLAYIENGEAVLIINGGAL